ncbi:TPA: hypothetical protein GF098_19710 [Escherichia coli]|nr:hypothetical protein [Escherichia coli]
MDDVISWGNLGDDRVLTGFFLAAKVQPDGADIPGITLTQSGIAGSKAGVVGANAVPCRTTFLQVSRQHPGTGLNVQTGIGQQVVTGGEHAITTQNRNMSLINLHQAIVPAGYLPGFVPVITDGTGVQTAFFNGDGLQQKGINLIPLSGLPETPCPGRGEPEQSGNKQQNAPHHKRSEPAGETVTVWRSKSIIIFS